jgi:predicted regulator of Ras-like GTPase activity (Roadblock/LC7/MglB family)
MTEPFTGLLAELVASVDGSIGAAFVDHYGEAVECYSVAGDDEYLRLMGAYEGIMLQTSRAVLRGLEAGGIDYYFASYENASLLIKALQQDYFLLLALSPGANIGQGVYRIRRAAEAFDREI